MLVTGRAPPPPPPPPPQAHQDTPGHTFFGQALNRSSCFLRVDAASKESFIGREGLTKLCSMVLLYDLKMTELVSLRPFAMYSWLMTVEQSKYIEQLISRSYQSSCLQQSQRWRKRQQWSSWQVEEEKYRLRLRQAQRRCSLRLKGPFVVRAFTRIQGIPLGSEQESMGICLWRPRLW